MLSQIHQGKRMWPLASYANIVLCVDFSPVLRNDTTEKCMMQNQDEISQQQDLLAIYRRRLAHNLNQQAKGHGTSFALMEDIRDSRAAIRRIKAALRTAGVLVEDHPDDEHPDDLRDSSASAAGIFFIPINLPTVYVARKDALAALRAALLDTCAAGGGVAVTALHGQGGLGKTVLARAICDDPDVRDAFPNGIL